MQNNTGPVKGYAAGGALSQFRRVRISGTQLAYAGSTDQDCIGQLERDAFFAGEIVGVRQRTAQGTSLMVASGAIAAYVGIYADDNGKVSASGTVLIGLNLGTAATADGDIIEVLTYPAAFTGTIARSSLTQDTGVYPISIGELKTVADPTVASPTTATTTNLGITVGTQGTSAPIVVTTDSKAATTTETLRIRRQVPSEYVAGQPISLVLNAGMVTTVADTTATIQVACYDSTVDPTTNIQSGGAQSINSLTAANKTFTITPTSVRPGDILDIKVTIAIVDGATGTAVKGTINPDKSYFQFARKG